MAAEGDITVSIGADADKAIREMDRMERAGSLSFRQIQRAAKIGFAGVAGAIGIAEHGFREYAKVNDQALMQLEAFERASQRMWREIGRGASESGLVDYVTRLVDLYPRASDAAMAAVLTMTGNPGAATAFMALAAENDRARASADRQKLELARERALKDELRRFRSLDQGPDTLKAKLFALDRERDEYQKQLNLRKDIEDSDKLILTIEEARYINARKHRAELEEHERLLREIERAAKDMQDLQDSNDADRDVFDRERLDQLERSRSARENIKGRAQDAEAELARLTYGEKYADAMKRAFDYQRDLEDLKRQDLDPQDLVKREQELADLYANLNKLDDLKNAPGTANFSRGNFAGGVYSAYVAATQGGQIQKDQTPAQIKQAIQQSNTLLKKIADNTGKDGKFRWE